MLKKGQISLFLIVGILFIVLMGVVFYAAPRVFKEKPVSQGLELQKDSTGVEDYVSECLMQSLERSAV